MKTILHKLFASFDNTAGGLSARKLTAFAMMWLIAWCHRLVDATNVVEVLMIDCGFVLLLLGIITAQNVIELKNGIDKKANGQDTTNP